MPLICPWIRRVKIEKCVLRVPRRDDFQRIIAFNFRRPEPFRQRLSKHKPFVCDFFRGCPGPVVSPACIPSAAERLVGENPDGPCYFNVRKHIRIIKNNPCLPVKVPAVEACLNLLLQTGKVVFQNPVKGYQTVINIIYNFNFRGFFGKKDRTASEKRLTIQFLCRRLFQNFNDSSGKLLFPAIIRNGSFYFTPPPVYS